MSKREPIDLLAMVVATGPDVGQLTAELSRKNFHFTQIDSSGGFLLDSSICLLAGLNKTDLQSFLDLVGGCCHTRQQYIPVRADISNIPGQPYMIEAEVGGATIFCFDVDQFVQL